MKNNKTNKTEKSYIQLIILLGLIVLFVGTFFNFFQQNHENKAVIDNQGYVLKDILKSVSTHIDIPDDVPLMALIDNADDLKKNQKFYTDAKDGDILLIFASEAIIYRPINDVIVNVGPVIFDQS